MSAADTRGHILDAAERLFAERGFDATSLRNITYDAGANLAAVHYHFGSKDALIEAVLCRRLDELNAARLEALGACEAAAGSGPPDLECVVRAFVGPTLFLAQRHEGGGERFMRLMGQAYSQPGNYLFRIFKTRYGQFIERFRAALERALPESARPDLVWRFHFMIGAMAHTMANAHHLSEMSSIAIDTSDTEATVERLVAFVAAGLRTPVATPTGGRT